MHRACLALRWTLAFAIGLLSVPLVGGIALAPQASAADCREHQYAVYLSPGHQQGVRWGGYHVTITEFNANHVCNRSMKTLLHQAWNEVQGGKPFSFKSKIRKDYREQRLNTQWGVAFNSGLLTGKLKPRLQQQGFLGVKSHWHISLYSDTGQQAIRKFETLKDVPWRLFVVRKPDKMCQEHGTNCPRDFWEEIN